MLELKNTREGLQNTVMSPARVLQMYYILMYHICIIIVAFCNNVNCILIIFFVVALPVIIRQPSSIVVQVFDIGSFECNARSYGDVSISWKRLNSKLPESINITESISLNEITSVLRLENVGYYKGYYYCVIENSVGTVNSALAHYDISGTLYTVM